MSEPSLDSITLIERDPCMEREKSAFFDLTLTSHTFFLARSRSTSLAEEDNLLCLAREPMVLAGMQVGRLMQLEVAKYIYIACQRCVY